MSAIYIVDTSVLLNILDVPGYNQDRDTVLTEFEERIKARSRFQLPIAAIVETGNHIADVSKGHHRRCCAAKFCDMVEKALVGQAPWVVTPMPDVSEIRKWLMDFPDQYAMRGFGIADRSIIHAWEEARTRNRGVQVTIWSLDRKLASYSQKP